MRSYLYVGAVLVTLCLPADAQNSYVTQDGINRAPAVTLHCAGQRGNAVVCGTAANPLIVSGSAGASSSVNQLSQIAAEQSSAQALGGLSDPAFSGGQGSVVSLMKGVWSALTNGVPATPTNGILVSRTVTLSAQQSTTVFPPNPTRRYLSFQVPQASYVWINLVGGPAAPNGPDCAFFAAGTFYESGQFVNRGLITVYAPLNVVFSAWEG